MNKYEGRDIEEYLKERGIFDKVDEVPSLIQTTI